MKKRDLCNSIERSVIRSKSLSVMSPRRIVLEGMSVCSEMIRVASCSADISSEKKPTMPPFDGRDRGRPRCTSPAPGLGDVVGDVGGERGLAHAGTAGEDDEVGGLQAAHLGVEVGQAGGDAGQVAVALIGARGHVDGGGQRLREALEAAVVAAGLGEFDRACARRPRSGCAARSRPARRRRC